MWRRVIIAGFAYAIFFPACAQITKQFSVDDKSEIEKVDFSLKVNGGYYVVKSSPMENDLINIYTNQDLNHYTHQYKKEIKNNICNVSLDLQEDAGHSLSQKINFQVFGGTEKVTEKVWKVLLSPGKPYSLNLNYGVGVANIDLTGLAVDILKVHSGNADVKIDYDPNTCNLTEMDTFSVKVDLGSVMVKRLNLSKAHYVQADVGFGDMYLDFSDNPTISSTIKGSVGAGNLIITLPEDEVPVMVKINESWLCHVQLNDNFRKIEENTYINEAYEAGAKNLLSFDLDVSMGSIIFKKKK